MSRRRVALVTGAARRIGQGIALELAEHGWSVAVHYRHSEAEAQDTVAKLRALGVDSAAFQADVAAETECAALVPRVVERIGCLDAVVNNASLFEHDEAADFTVERMERHWRANTVAPMLLTRALAAHVASRNDRGCVVNLLDQKLWNLNPDHLSYTLSKATLETATRLLAMAFAPTLRVCAVAPGVTLPSGPMSDQEFSEAHRMTPLQHSSTPKDVAQAVRFLVEAPSITGTTLLVDGGQHLQAQGRDVLYLAREAWTR